MSWLMTALTGPLLTLLLGHLDRRMAARTSAEGLSAEIAKESIRAELAARAQARAVLIAEQGHFLSAARLGRLLFVVPLGVWWAAVIADSIFAFSFDIAALPSPLDDWAGGILLSLFLVDGVQGSLRAARARRRDGG